MKILMVGAENEAAIENCYVKYFKELGANVERYSAQKIFFKYYHQSIKNKIIHKLGFSGVYRKINEELKKLALTFKPDFIFIFKGMEIYPSTLRWCKQNGFFLANFNGDNPFIFTGKGSGNANISKSIDLYDLHFTYNLEVKTEIEKRNIKTAYLPFGFDVSDNLFNACAEEPEIKKMCFIGNPDKQRIAFILKLAELGIEMDIYGSDAWSKAVKHSNITVKKAVYGDDFWRMLRKYRVQLNLMRIHNETGHNMRSFEVPGIGGVMLAQDTVEHRMFFEDKKEVFLFNSVQECAERTREILSMSEEEINAIRTAARIKSIEEGYSYKHRANQVYSCFTEILS